MLLVSTSQYLLRFVSTLMVGHVGTLYLSGAVVSMSFTNVTGFSLLSQYLILPLLVSSAATLAFHVPICWALVFKFHMGSDGAALAIGLSYCLEWWAYETVILLVGVMKNPQLETSVLSISITVAVLHSFASNSLSAAASVRVSNELGAGNAKVILSSRNSGGSSIGFSGAFEGQGSLDQFINRRSGAKYSACYYNKFIRLEERGIVF
ncbi:hypothetical protein POM88_052180 [Heracleum sosnowskyi]|uniref:Uncharacterized protein n=1 Tax=Heracleum sosnowskyi TaxID=360622 RepID=A0AAD8GTE0_9APIA|nr:hypothetical protein POM88_052180 [Heracleum sosnowskyi]